MPHLDFEKRVIGWFERTSVWSFVAVISLCIFLFQGLEGRVKNNEQAVGRLQEGKVSREELKDMQNSILREIGNSRNEFKNSIDVFRHDVSARLDLVIRNTKDTK